MGNVASTKVRPAIPNKIRPILAVLIILLLISSGWMYLLYASAAEFLATFPALLINANDADSWRRGVQRYEQSAQIARRLRFYGPLIANRPSSAVLDGLALLSDAATQIEATLGVPIRLWESGTFAGALRHVAEAPPARPALSRAAQTLLSTHALLAGDPEPEYGIVLLLGYLQRAHQALELTPHLPSLLGKSAPQQYLVLTLDERVPQALGGRIDRAFIATISEGGLGALLPANIPASLLTAAAQTPDLPSLAPPLLAHFENAQPAGIIILNRYALHAIARLAGLPETALIDCGRYCDATVRRVQAVLNVPAPKLLLFTLATLIEQRHVLLFSTEAEVQALLSQWRWDGEQFVPRTGDYLMLTYATLDGATCTPQPLRAAYTVDLQVGRVVLHVLSAPCEAGMVRVYGPFDFTDARLEDGTLLVTFDEPAAYGGYRVEFPCGTSCPTLSYALPNAALPQPGPDGLRRYDLTLQRPPLSPPSQIAVTIYFPRGVVPAQSPAAARVDEAAGTVSLTVELSSDERVSITFP